LKVLLLLKAQIAQYKVSIIRQRTKPQIYAARPPSLPRSIPS